MSLGLQMIVALGICQCPTEKIAAEGTYFIEDYILGIRTLKAKMHEFTLGKPTTFPSYFLHAVLLLVRNRAEFSENAEHVSAFVGQLRDSHPGSSVAVNCLTHDDLLQTNTENVTSLLDGLDFLENTTKVLEPW